MVSNEGLFERPSDYLPCGLRVIKKGYELMVPPNRVGQSWTLEIAASDISADLSYFCLGLLLKLEGKVKGKGAVEAEAQGQDSL